jgi:uncharacterized membrane protein YhaH (DUF805 family)
MGWVLLLIILVGFSCWRAYEHHRSKEFADAAAGLGLQFQKKAAVDHDLKGFNLFSYGYDTTGIGLLGLKRYPAQHIDNVIHGIYQGVSVKVFGYTYGSYRRVDRQTVCMFKSDEFKLPKFDLCPEHFLYKMASVFGGQDIDFPEHPNFSQLYRLKSEDEWAARKLFNQEVLRTFERHPDLYVEGSSQWLIVYRSGKRVRPSELSQFLVLAYNVYHLFAHGRIVESHGADPASTFNVEESLGDPLGGVPSEVRTVGSPENVNSDVDTVEVGIHGSRPKPRVQGGMSIPVSRILECFLFKGRTNRSNWWLWWLAVLGAWYGAGITASSLYFATLSAGQTDPVSDFSEIPNFLIVVLIVLFGWLLISAWLLVAVSVRRLHDMNHSGSWLWIALLPSLGLIILFIWLGFFPPQPESGPNKYG